MCPAVRRVAVLAAVIVAPVVAADTLGPFRAVNLTPPIAIVGLPVWSRVPDSTTVGLTTELANHYRLSQRVGDVLILDGETLRLRGFVEVPFGRGWSFAADLPFYSQSGGVLDDLVDAWHSAFGLPDGSRNARPEGVLEFEMADPAGSFYRLGESGTGLGDLQLGIARRVGARERVTLRGSVKLPTGSERLLAGSGETDVALSALAAHDGNLRGRDAGFFYGGAVVAFGQPENVRFPVEDYTLAAVAGGALSVLPRFGVKGQVEVNSALYDSQLEELGQTAVQATIGGWYRFGATGLFEYAVSEDLHVSTTPDVVLYLNLSFRLR